MPPMSDDAALITPAPPARRRRWIAAFAASFIVFQLILPLRYYLFGQTHDERFAWRMFSTVHLSDRKYTLFETQIVDGRRVERPIPNIDLHQWDGQLSRGRLATVEKVLRWWTDRSGAVEARYELTSVTPDGRSHATVHAWLDAATGQFHPGERPRP